MSIDIEPKNVISEAEKEQRELRFLYAINQSYWNEKISFIDTGIYLNSIGFKQTQVFSGFFESMKKYGYEIDFFSFQTRIVYFREVQ